MIRSRTVKIDPEKFKAWSKSKGLTFKEISIAIGEYDAFISKVFRSGEFPCRKYDLFCSIFGVNQSDFLPDKPPAQKPTEEATTAFGLPYSIQLSVHPDRVRVKIMYSGEELYSSFARLKGNTELDLIQGISYATHLCYKFAEQKYLESGGK